MAFALIGALNGCHPSVPAQVIVIPPGAQVGEQSGHAAQQDVPQSVYVRALQVLASDSYLLLARNDATRQVVVRSHVDETDPTRVTQIALAVDALGTITLNPSGYLVLDGGRTWHHLLADEVEKLRKQLSPNQAISTGSAPAGVPPSVPERPAQAAAKSGVDSSAGKVVAQVLFAAQCQQGNQWACMNLLSLRCSNGDGYACSQYFCAQGNERACEQLRALNSPQTSQPYQSSPPLQAYSAQPSTPYTEPESRYDNSAELRQIEEQGKRQRCYSNCDLAEINCSKTCRIYSNDESACRLDCHAEKRSCVSRCQ